MKQYTNYKSIGDNEQIYNDSVSSNMPIDHRVYSPQYNYQITNNKGDLTDLSKKKMQQLNEDYELNSFLYLRNHPDRHWSRANQILEKNVAEENYEHDNDDVKIVFFSKENIDVIQKMIIMEVFERSNGRFLIPKQKWQQIQIVQQYIYKQYAKNLPYDVKEQVKQLNKILVSEVVPDILTNTDQYMGYLDDINNPIRPIDRPLNVSSKGTRTLPSVLKRVSEDRYI